MATLDAVINTPISFTIAGPDTTTPLTDSGLYLDGAVTSEPISSNRIGSTIMWRLSFTPASTGTYTVFAFSAVQAQIQSVPRSVQSFLANLEDESLGSWSWDKTTGVLTMVRQNGTTLATYNVTDTLSLATRERVS
jgi:hypothetical protein